MRASRPLGTALVGPEAGVSCCRSRAIRVLFFCTRRRASRAVIMRPKTKKMTPSAMPAIWSELKPEPLNGSGADSVVGATMVGIDDDMVAGVGDVPAALDPPPPGGKVDVVGLVAPEDEGLDDAPLSVPLGDEPADVDVREPVAVFVPVPVAVSVPVAVPVPVPVAVPVVPEPVADAELPV